MLFQTLKGNEKQFIIAGGTNFKIASLRFWKDLEIQFQMAVQEGCHSDIMMQFLCDMTSSPHDPDRKGDILRRTFDPLT